MINSGDINSNLYRTFIAVAESKSFAEAAEKLCTTDRGVSNDINLLEKQLDVQLFYRKHKGSNNGMKITEIGKEIYPQAKRIISECDFIPTMVESGSSLENGKLSIGCPSHITEFFLMEKLIKLTNDYPNVKVKIDSESSGKKLMEELIDNELDFIIIDAIPDVNLEEFEVKKINDIDNIFVAKDKIEINNAKELSNYKFILDYKDRLTTKKLVNALNEHGVEIGIVLQCPTAKLRMEAAKGGVGISYIMRDVCQKELENGELYEVKVPIGIPINSINLVYRKENLTKVDKAFIKKYLDM